MYSIQKKSMIIRVSTIFCSAMFLVACGSGDKQETMPVTQLNELTTAHPHACSQALLTVGADLIGQKTHFLHRQEQPILTNANDTVTDSKNEKAQNLDVKNDNKEKGSPNLLPDANPLVISGLLEYNDRPAHIRFGTYLNTSKNQCVVEYQLDYHFNEPCMTIREEAFKRWRQVSKLGDKTVSYVHTRYPNRRAYLTNIERNVQCLVSVRDVQIK